MVKKLFRPKAKPMTKTLGVLALAVTAILLALASTGLIGSPSDTIQAVMGVFASLALMIEVGLVAMLLRKKKLSALPVVFGGSALALFSITIAGALDLAVPALLASWAPWLVVIVAVGLVYTLWID